MTSSANCFHCGESIPAGTDIRVTVEGASRKLCCPGCLAACTTIMDSGLQGYYQLREGMPETPGQEAEDFSMYNLPAVYEQFSLVQDDERIVTQLSIGGMHCAACAWLIEQALEQVPGVELATVNFQRAVASISWRRGALQPADLFERVSSLGYGVAPFSSSASEKLVQREIDGMLGRLGVAGIGMMQVGMVAIGLYAGGFSDISAETSNLLRYFSLLVATPILLFSAQPFFAGAWRGIRSGLPGIDVPVSLALLAAYLASVYATVLEHEHVYFDTVCMFTFFLLLGRYLLLLAQRRQLGEGVLLPVSARVMIAGDATAFEWRAVQQLCANDVVVVHPGETVPVDGIVRHGSSSIDETSVTGEFHPRAVSEGAEVVAGTRNIDGSLQLQLGREPSTFRMRQIDALMSQATEARPRLAMLADRVATHFVVIVLLAATASYFFWLLENPTSAFVTALAVLVVSCPCALSLATPATFTAATTGLRRRGVLVADAGALERLPRVTHAVFDKTGTLTEGRPRIQSIKRYNDQYSERELLGIAASLERHSAHPIAHAFDKVEAQASVHNVQVHSGLGICADMRREKELKEGEFKHDEWRIGSAEYCVAASAATGAALPPSGSEPATSAAMPVYIACNGEILAEFLLSDPVRQDARALLDSLRSRDIEIQILSGDRSDHVAGVAAQLGVQRFLHACSAEQKMRHIAGLQENGATVIMVGDGVNDAPVIAAADVSVAMHASSELTRSKADFTLLADGLHGVGSILECAGRARLILYQNFAWALAYNFTALPLAAAGFVPPLVAAIGMSASSLLVVLNAARAGVIRSADRASEEERRPVSSRWRAALNG